MDIGIRLQAVRKGKGLSQRELAKRVGVTNSTISLIERDRISPSVDTLSAILDALGTTLPGFFSGITSVANAGNTAFEHIATHHRRHPGRRAGQRRMAATRLHAD